MCEGPNSPRAYFAQKLTKFQKNTNATVRIIVFKETEKKTSQNFS